MAKKIDKRKYKIPSLRLKKKGDIKACSSCIWFRNDELNRVRGFGRCKKFDVRVQKKELCDSYSAFTLHRELNKDRKRKYTEDQIGDLKKYQTLGRSSNLSIEPTGGVINEQQYTPIVTTKDYETGFIERYFVQRRSHKANPVMEVANFSAFNGKYFNQVTVLWKITGPRRYDTHTPDGLLIEKSIYNYNRDAIKYASRQMPQLKFKVTNFVFLAYQRQSISDVDYEGIETSVQKVYKKK